MELCVVASLRLCVTSSRTDRVDISTQIPRIESCWTAHQERIEFLLRLGRALHTYGSGAHRLEDVLAHVTEKLGLEGQFFSTPTSIFAAFGSQGEQRTH